MKLHRKYFFLTDHNVRIYFAFVCNRTINATQLIFNIGQSVTNTSTACKNHMTIRIYYREIDHGQADKEIDKHTCGNRKHFPAELKNVL